MATVATVTYFPLSERTSRALSAKRARRYTVTYDEVLAQVVADRRDRRRRVIESMLRREQSYMHDDALATYAAQLADSLPAEDRDRFVHEAAEAFVGYGRGEPLAELIADWAATAAIWSDPALAAALSGDITSPLDLPVE